LPGPVAGEPEVDASSSPGPTQEPVETVRPGGPFRKSRMRGVLHIVT